MGHVQKCEIFTLTSSHCSGKDSRPSTISSDSQFSDTRIKKVVAEEMERDHYQTVHRDGRKLAVINADEMEDGIILVPGRYRYIVHTAQCRQSVIFLNFYNIHIINCNY